MLVILNLPLIGIWVRLLRVPYHTLFPPAIVAFVSIGAIRPTATHSIFMPSHSRRALAWE